MKGTVAVIGALCLSPLLLAGTAVFAVAAGDIGPTTHFACATGPADATPLDTSAARNVRVKGLDLPSEQIPNARTIVTTGIRLGVPARGQIVALATAMQESRLRNLAYGDRDSLGLFQQRPSQGWGSPTQVRDPAHAATKFYQALLKVAGWQQLTVTQAAQAVQRSGFPDAYAQWETLARTLQQTLAPTAKNTNPPTSSPTSAPASATGCSAGKDGTGFGPIPEGAVPKGYTVPAGADPRAKTAITWAMRQLGTLYQWGGTCTAPRGPDPMGRCDCSSLTQQAYRQAGITLTRTTYTQIGEGRPVPLGQLQAGDLVFSRGSATRPEHVGLALGSGLIIEAPRTGKPVRISRLADFGALAARRVL